MASTRPIAFNLRAWGAWSAEDPPGDPDSPGGRDAHPAPALLRRRVGVLGQHALRLAWGMACSGEARLIASSRHGEFRRSLGILDAIIADADVSPAEFTLSVHHALVGLLSIARGNCRAHTAIAAGPESFCFGFMEAVACLAENPAEPVLLIHYDEPLPEPFDRFDSAPGPALALVMALAANAGPGEAMTLMATPTAAPGPMSSPSPAAGFRAFLDDPGAPRFTAVGPRMTWQWSRHVAAAHAAAR